MSGLQELLSQKLSRLQRMPGRKNMAGMVRGRAIRPRCPRQTYPGPSRRCRQRKKEYNTLSEEILTDIIKGNEVASAKQEHLIIHGVNGRAIVARSANQQLLAKSFEENDLTFAIGPAGSGKTFVAIALAVKALKSKQVRDRKAHV